MKKLLIVAASMLLAGSVYAKKPIAVDHEYEIDTWGANSEVYEFTPKGNKNYTCIFLMLDNAKAMGLQCFPKKT